MNNLDLIKVKLIEVKEKLLRSRESRTIKDDIDITYKICAEYEVEYDLLLFKYKNLQLYLEKTL